MIKKITHLFLMGIVIFSLFAPSIIPLLECENDAIVIIDFSEEENKKDNKKELDEKDVYFQDLLSDNNEVGSLTKGAAFHYFMKSSDFNQRIVLPPPERMS